VTDGVLVRPARVDELERDFEPVPGVHLLTYVLPL